MNQPHRRVGLLVIHGIGEQAPGQTRDEVAAAFRLAYPDALESGDTFDLDGCKVRLYEVYWAPVLSGAAVDGSFKIESLQQLVWFPLLNHRRLPSHKRLYPNWLVWAWTAVLIPVGVLLTAAYYGFLWLLTMVASLRQPASRRQRGGGKQTRFEAASARARERTGSRLLDRVGADVLNYVNAAAGAPAPVQDAEDRIYERVENALRQAAQDECTEIQVLAHSLGSLIAYRALTLHFDRLSELVELPFGRPASGRPPVTRFFTIGSPIEKIRFFWPKLVLAHAGAISPDSRLGWHNFKSPFDLVAGLVTRDTGLSRQIRNHVVQGAGGLMRAHSAYLRNPAFLGIFGFELTGEAARPAQRRWNPLRFLRQFLLETLPLPLGLLFLSLAGLILMLLTGAISGYAIALPVRWGGEGLRWIFSADWQAYRLWADWIREFFMWLFPGILLGLAVPLGLADASEAHKKHWLWNDAALAGGVAKDQDVNSFERSTGMPGTEVSQQRAPRKVGHFLGSVALLAAIAWVGLRYQPRENAWLLILALMTAFALLNGHGISGARWGILIDSRNKISLSRLQMLAWTLLVLSALLTAILSNVTGGMASPMDIEIPSQIWVLLGISTATAVSAPALLSAKRRRQADGDELQKTLKGLDRQGQTAVDTDEGSIVIRNASIQDARWSELLKGDESGNASVVDLGKLQMFFFTFILVFGYGAALYAMFAGRGEITAFPPVQEGMNVLLGISQTGYLASKAVTVSKEAEQPAPSTAAVATGAGR